MKAILLATALMLTAVRGVADEWPLKNLSNEAELAYLALSRADTFAFGPVGFAAFTAEGDLAMRILVRHPKAVGIFQLVAERASPGGL